MSAFTSVSIKAAPSPEMTILSIKSCFHQANHDPTSASKRWHGARKLLKKSCSEELPKLDPVTGEDVPWMGMGSPTIPMENVDVKLMMFFHVEMKVIQWDHDI